MRLKNKQIQAKFTPALKSYITQAGYNPVYGARPLRRVIQDQILDELALVIIENRIESGAKVTVDYKNGKVTSNQPN